MDKLEERVGPEGCRLFEDGFTWDGGTLRKADEIRKTYIAAFKSADNYDFAPLLAFVRS